MKKKQKTKSHIPSALKEVYTKKAYIYLSIIITLLLVSLNIAVVNYRAYIDFKKPEVLVKIFFGTFYTLPVHSIMLLFISSILAGIFIALATYHMKCTHKIKKYYATGSSGLLLGIIAPSCTACGIGLAAILGLTGVISTLPFDGLEISYAGILLLTWAIFSISKKITRKTCSK